MAQTYPYPHVAPPPSNILVGVIATTALLAAAMLGRAVAHTTLTLEPQAHAHAALTPALAPAPQAAPAVAAPPTPPPQTFRQMTPQEAQAFNASIPFSDLPNPAAAAFKLDVADAIDHTRALNCLTMAVYYEAANEPDQGQAAVAQVVLNRLRNPLFPKTVCGVVLQGSTLPTGCQFTFTCDGSLGRPPSPAGWLRAQRVAERALDGYVEKSVGEATHYHTIWVAPYWQSSVVKLTRIGAHIFYRWDGELGRPASFRGLYAGAEPEPPVIHGYTDPEPTALAVIKAPPVQAQPAAPAMVIAPVAPKPAPAIKLAAAQSLNVTQPPQIQAFTANESYFGQSAGASRPGGLQRLPVN